jgi:hypothetical protein
MILSQIASYLSEHRRASLANLAIGLRAAPEAVEGMLSTLERKGLVRRLPSCASCTKGCGGCDPATLQIYEWVGRRTS